MDEQAPKGSDQLAHGLLVQFHLEQRAASTEASTSRRSRGSKDTALSILRLTLIVPLARQASTWERAAQLAQVDDMLRTLVKEGRKHKPRLDVHRALPVFVVADPEAYRPTLVKRLHERARSLGDGRVVLLKELRFDRPVEQRSLGLDQVELFLNVEGLAEVQLA